LGYILVFIAAMMWSFVGILVKMASTMVNSHFITFCRFFIGVLFLGGFLFIKDKRIDFHLRNKWIYIGAIGKCCNYIFENLAITKGYAYGDALVAPMQAVFLVIISALFLKEPITTYIIVGSLIFLAGLIIINLPDKNIALVEAKD
jgi:drug/metabolite transporter (DMT)-like permease